MDWALRELQDAAETFWRSLSNLDAPIGALLALSAIAYWLWRRLGLLERWRTRRGAERKLLSSLSAAGSYGRFKQLLGTEPDYSRPIEFEYSPTETVTSQFFVLRRTWVEAFVNDQLQVIGFTVTLRTDKTLGGAIDINGKSITLGRDHLSDVDDNYYRPEKLYTNRGAKICTFVEASEPYGFTTGFAWAFGYCSAGGGAWPTGATLDALEALCEESGSRFPFRSISAGAYSTAPPRRQVIVNTASCASGHCGIFPELLSLHPEEAFAVDPDAFKSRRH